MLRVGRPHHRAADRDRVGRRRRGGLASDARRARARPRPCAQFAAAFDARRGGFGDAPKFPRPSELLFLLREHARTGDDRRARHGAVHAARDGARRHARPPRRRLPSLLGGRRLARAALREDALRPGAARARLPRGGAGVAAIRSSRSRRGHAAVRAARDDRSGRRLLFRRGRRQRSARAGRRPDTRTRPKARSTSGRCDEVRALLGRRRARRSSAASASCPTATRRSIRSRSSPARTCCTPRVGIDEIAEALGRTPEDGGRVADARAARRCSPRARSGRGRISTTRC